MGEAARLFLFTGHPKAGSLSAGLADAYQRGAETLGAEVRRMDLCDMRFDPNLADGYAKFQPLEDDLVAWKAALSWCSHTAWVFPLWWGTMPAKMKGVVDRCLVPGYAYKFREGGSLWDKLLTGRTADLLVTSDTPAPFMTLSYGNPVKKQMTRQVLGFCGIKTTRYSLFSPVRKADGATIDGWKRRAHSYGAEAGRR
ncbi:MAG: NAD(P)H-dependent oxidoreductase [Pseudomonadota bacterium]